MIIIWSNGYRNSEGAQAAGRVWNWAGSAGGGEVDPIRYLRTFEAEDVYLRTGEAEAEDVYTRSRGPDT